jgi:hypothetical protein
VLKELLTLLLTPPNIPRSCHNICSRLLEDFHKFGSAGWSNLPEAEVISELSNDIHTGTLPQATNNLVIYTTTIGQSIELGYRLDSHRIKTACANGQKFFSSTQHSDWL